MVNVKLRNGYSRCKSYSDAYVVVYIEKYKNVDLSFN